MAKFYSPLIEGRIITTPIRACRTIERGELPQLQAQLRSGESIGVKITVSQQIPAFNERGEFMIIYNTLKLLVGIDSIQALYDVFRLFGAKEVECCNFFAYT